METKTCNIQKLYHVIRRDYNNNSIIPNSSNIIYTDDNKRDAEEIFNQKNKNKINGENYALICESRIFEILTEK